jgi:hypothetical protein
MASTISPTFRHNPSRTTRLETPPVPYICDGVRRAGVFDAFGWCESRDLEWRCADGRWDDSTPIDGSNPARMVFVIRPGVQAPFLPQEPAYVHAPGLGMTDQTGEQALAPWAIDHATDELFARRAVPGDLLWLAADNLNALFWGLHDWAHFHNHGPFEPGQRAWTELQCDASALVWLCLAHDAVKDAAWERARRSAVALSAERFASEGLAFDVDALGAERLQTIAARARRS